MYLKSSSHCNLYILVHGPWNSKRYQTSAPASGLWTACSSSSFHECLPYRFQICLASPQNCFKQFFVIKKKFYWFFSDSLMNYCMMYKIQNVKTICISISTQCENVFCRMPKRSLVYKSLDFY
jgi:hypothetical protein